MCDIEDSQLAACRVQWQVRGIMVMGLLDCMNVGEFQDQLGSYQL
jgi:hypothetical protein